MKNIHPFETEELAAHLCGLNYDEIDADVEIIDSKMNAEYGIDLESFYKLVTNLLPLIEVGESALSGKLYKGFSAERGIWLVKTEVKK